MITPIISILVLIATVLCQSNNNCTENATWNDCASACPITCENVLLNINCNKMCEARCVCNPGFVLQDGRCIRYEYCDPSVVKCPGNSTFSRLVPFCPPSCSDLYYRSFYCLAALRPDCGCNEGYVKNLTDQCILIKDCDPNEIMCPDTMQYSSEGILKSCDNLNGDNEIKKPGCYCQYNWVYDNRTRNCIDPEECPNSAKNKECKEIDEHMEFSMCQSSSCVRTCTNRHPRICTADCRMGCFCKKGFLLLDNKCVTPDKCPTQ